MTGRGVAGLLMGMALVTAAPASASFTVGSSLRQRANLYVRCSAGCTELQTARPGSTALKVTVDGIITRWRLRSATRGTVRLRVLRAVGDGSYETVGAGAPEKLALSHRPGQDVLYTRNARIPVQVGDQIALDHDRAASGIFHSYGQVTSYAAATFTPQPADDAPATPATTGIGRELLLAADVERDADGDGFGDETQDNCPKIANDQSDNPCPPGERPTTTTTPPGDKPGDQPVGETTAGSEGPPLTGERAADRRTRGHGSRPAARRTPVAGRSGPSGHSRRSAARRPPRRAGKRDSSAHSRRPAARRGPARARRRATSRHGSHSRRRPPARVRRRSSDSHRGRAPRRAPARLRATPSKRHGDRPPPRRAPRPVPEPGFHGH